MKPEFRERYVAAHLKAMTVVARCVGVMAIAGGITGIFGYAFLSEHSSANLVFGIVSIVIGIVILRAKRLERKDLHWFERK